MAIFELKKGDITLDRPPSLTCSWGSSHFNVKCLYENQFIMYLLQRKGNCCLL